MKEIKELIALKDQKKALEAQIKAIEKIIMEECFANGVKEIYAGATHGVLVGPAIERIKNIRRKANVS